MVKRPEEGVFEAVPKFVAGGHGIGEGKDRKQRKGFGVFNLVGELADDGRVFEVATLRQAGHEQVVLDYQAEGVRDSGIEGEPAGSLKGEVGTDLRLVSVSVLFAD